MSKYTKEIDQEELKELVSSFKSCKLDSYGCVLEPKFGKVSLDLSRFKSIESYQLHLKRVSGNGKVNVSVKDQPHNFTVLSKIAQSFKIDTDSANLDISRPDDSLGEVCLFGITIGYSYQDEENILSYNWKSLIGKCGKYGCLRMLDGRLFASEGAYIENGTIIKEIETIPHGMSFRDGDSIKFAGACEVVKLEVDNSYSPETPHHTFFAHRAGPSPTLQTTHDTSFPHIAMPEKDISKPPKEEPRFANNIAYDSNNIRGMDKTRIGGADNKQVKFINSNGKDYVLLKKGGSIALPISALQIQKEYIVVLTVKLINGNGKVSVSFASGSDQPKNFSTTIAENNFFDKYITVNTGQQTYPGESFRLYVSMLDDSSGEVLISRILIVESVPKISREEVIRELTFAREPPLVLNYTYKDISVKKSTQMSAVVYADQYSSPDVFEANYVFEPLTYDARLWVGRVNSMLKGIKVKDRKNLMYNVYKTGEDPSLVIGALGFLKVANRIFVDEWNIRTKPSERDLSILSLCGTIITPSIINLQVLKQLLPDKQIICLPLLLPGLNVEPRKENSYFVYFEKTPKATDTIISYWQSNYHKLYVVGSTKGLPDYMGHISEYSSYQEIMAYVLGSSGIINISDNTNYMSYVDTMALRNDFNLVTNNLFNLSNEHKRAVFLNSKVEDDSTIALDKFTAKAAFEQMMVKPSEESPRSFKSDYNQLFKENILKLVGAQ